MGAAHCGTKSIRLSVQYNTIQYNTIQYNTIQYNTIQYNTIQYNTIQYNTIQYNTIQYNTIQYNTIQYNTIGCSSCKERTSTVFTAMVAACSLTVALGLLGGRGSEVSCTCVFNIPEVLD